MNMAENCHPLVSQSVHILFNFFFTFSSQRLLFHALPHSESHRHGTTYPSPNEKKSTAQKTQNGTHPQSTLTFTRNHGAESTPT